MYKVFINDKPLILTDDINSYNEEGSGMLLRFDAKKGFMLAIDALESQENVGSLFVVNDDLQHLWETFCSEYSFVEAAGGLVKNPGNEILFINRLGKWDLPKGKIKEGEEKEKAAAREVEEECGIRSLTIVKELAPTYHTYNLDDKKILKKTYWFEMTYEGDEQLTPQTEEGIIEVKWFGREEIDVALGNTYNSIRELAGSLIG